MRLERHPEPSSLVADDGVTPIGEMSQQQLRAEIFRLKDARPSSLVLAPIGTLAGAGTLSLLAAGILNIDIRVCGPGFFSPRITIVPTAVSRSRAPRCSPPPHR